MQVIPNLKADSVNEQVVSGISGTATLTTDDFTSYVDLKGIAQQHYAQVIPKEKIGEVLPWAQLAISNAKRLLLDVHHFI